MKILFCSDGSSQAENAVRFGALIAAACQAEPSILGITEKEGDEDSLLEALRRAQEIIKEHHLDAELITKAGRPVSEIVKRTREGSYDLVVIGAVRKTTRHPLWMSVDPLWMSARAYKIIESVEPPVLVVIGDHGALQRILVCTSGGSQANKFVEFAGEIARHVNAVVDLFHVMPEPPGYIYGFDPTAGGLRTCAGIEIEARPNSAPSERVAGGVRRIRRVSTAPRASASGVVERTGTNRVRSGGVRYLAG